MKTKHQAGFLAIAVAAFAMACADPAGLDRTLLPGAPSLDVSVNPAAVGTLLLSDPAVPGGRVRVCKDTPAGDPSQNWSFSVTVASQIDDVPLNPVVAPPTPVVIAGVAGGDPECATVFTSTKNGIELDVVTVVEQALPANWSLLHIHIARFADGPGYTPPAAMPLDAGNLGTRTATLYINSDMQRDVTFGNDFTAPPPPICTYTKGWYQNNNGKPTVIAVDGRTIAQAQAIFEASPGQPGGVTWGVGALTDNKPNNLLNLYQQFLAALQNLGGDANEDNGPAAVDAAIDAVQAATGGTGLHISMVAGTDVGGLTATLSAFNEGTFAGFPHCDD